MQIRQINSNGGSEHDSLQLHIDALEALQQSDQAATNTSSSKATYTHLLNELKICLEKKHLIWCSTLSSGFSHWITAALLKAVLRQNEALQIEIDTLNNSLRSTSTQIWPDTSAAIRVFHCRLNQLRSSAAKLLELELRTSQPLQSMGIVDSGLMSRSTQPVIH